jgi:hypothetical protein
MLPIKRAKKALHEYDEQMQQLIIQHQRSVEEDDKHKAIFYEMFEKVKDFNSGGFTAEERILSSDWKNCKVGDRIRTSVSVYRRIK